MRRRTASWFIVLGALACGEHRGPGDVTRTARSPAAVTAAASAAVAAATAVGAPTDKQILFGDLHVHTTFSPDAFSMSLPLLGGEGAHPPADACDFARHCSQLDFWSINDHAEGLTPRRWQETRASVAQCNAVAGAGGVPDTIAFLGWEWTQVGRTAAEHYGHRNVVLRETNGPRVPARPVAAPDRQLGQAPMGTLARLGLAAMHWERRREYFDHAVYFDEVAAMPLCSTEGASPTLPADCLETAATPAVLARKLDEWEADALVIPHGMAWGLNQPPGVAWATQLAAGAHVPGRERVIESFSGHGNSEEYRPWRAMAEGGDGGRTCPAPTPDYLPCCWQAGEIIRARCDDARSDDCEARVREAQQLFVDAGIAGYRAIPGATLEDWLDCGQCRDCTMPAMDYRPGGSAQLALATVGENGERYRFGMIGSSDDHDGRPGTGYKEIGRHGMTDVGGSDSPRVVRFLGTDTRGPLPRAEPVDPDELPLQAKRYIERQASFYVTGGLVAVHAARRTRGAIWSALDRRETYATSGPRILLWFDHAGDDGTVRPMGSILESATAPRFRVRAVGARTQRPGCSEEAVRALGRDRTDRLCLGECFNPGDTRHRIARVEVVRIRPQRTPDEAIASLIEDPWRTLPCDDLGQGCVVEFSDPEFAPAGREHVYYVRAVQEPTPTINGDGLRCTRDADGVCTAIEPCYGDYRTPRDDDCLAPVGHRAWSSPIFVIPSTS